MYYFTCWENRALQWMQEC